MPVTPSQMEPGLAQPRPEWMLLLGVTLAATAVLLALEATDLDRFVAGWFFDPVAGGFPLRYNAFLEVVLHYWTKYVVTLIAGVAFAGFLLSFTVPVLRPHRRLLLFVGLSIVLSTAAVSFLKLVSVKQCPWNLADYGGLLPYTKLLEPAPPDTNPGHCFPAGHPAAGFSLLVFYFVGSARGSPRLARAGLALGLVTGLVLGFGRMLQGAHFLTHVLWSGVVCWLVILLLYLALFKGRGDRPLGTAGAHLQHGR